jgi:hypothetical protein
MDHISDNCITYALMPRPIYLNIFHDPSSKHRKSPGPSAISVLGQPSTTKERCAKLASSDQWIHTWYAVASQG